VESWSPCKNLLTGSCPSPTASFISSLADRPIRFSFRGTPNPQTSYPTFSEIRDMLHDWQMRSSALIRCFWQELRRATSVQERSRCVSVTWRCCRAGPAIRATTCRCSTGTAPTRPWPVQIATIYDSPEETSGYIDAIYAAILISPKWPIINYVGWNVKAYRPTCTDSLILTFSDWHN